MKGSDVPLAINLLGTQQRMAWALGVDDWSELETRIEHPAESRHEPTARRHLGQAADAG